MPLVVEPINTHAKAPSMETVAVPTITGMPLSPLKSTIEYPSDTVVAVQPQHIVELAASLVLAHVRALPRRLPQH